MRDSKNTSIKKSKINNNNNESHKENKYLNIKEDSLNIKIIQKKPNNQNDKNNKPLLINNQNHIDSINIISNNKNYKNIILNNMLTPNKKLLIKDKNTSRNKKNTIKIERNVLFENGNIKKNFRTLGQNKQKSIKNNNNNNNNNAFKLIATNQDREIANDIDMKYKLILYEKNNLINKLKNEVEYYKNFYHNINMNMNIILPNNSNNNTIEANNNKYSLGLNDKKNTDSENNVRNRIKNIFSLPKKDLKYDNNHLKQHNINDYNIIKTFVNNKTNSDTITFNSVETAKDYVPQLKNNFNTIENNSHNNSNNNDKNKFNNNNKLLLSNDSLKNDLIFKNNLEKNNAKTLNNIFYRSNSNTIQKKGRKLKLGLQQSELTLEMNHNNFNSIEANRNYSKNLKNKKHIIYSLNYFNSKTGSENELDHQNNNGISIEDNRNKNKHIFNNISSSPSSLYKDGGIQNYIDSSNSGLLFGKNDNTDIQFNYKDNFEKIKKRMNNLINNLFDLIETQNKKEKGAKKNGEN